MLRPNREQALRCKAGGRVRIVECDVAMRRSLAVLLEVKGFQVEEMGCHGDPFGPRDDGEPVILIMGDRALKRHEPAMVADRGRVARLAGAFLLSSIPTASWEQRARDAGIETIFEKPFLSGLVDRLSSMSLSSLG